MGITVAIKGSVSYAWQRQLGLAGRQPNGAFIMSSINDFCMALVKVLKESQPSMPGAAGILFLRIVKPFSSEISITPSEPVMRVEA